MSRCVQLNMIDNYYPLSIKNKIEFKHYNSIILRSDNFKDKESFRYILQYKVIELSKICFLRFIFNKGKNYMSPFLKIILNQLILL